MQETAEFRYQRIRKATEIFLVAMAFSLPLSTTATCILFPLTTLLSLFSDPWYKKWRAIVSQPLALGLIAFIVLYMIGAFYSIAPSHDIFHQFLKTSNFLGALILMGFFCEPQWRKYVLNAFLVAMKMTLVLSYTKYFFNPTLLSTPFGQSNIFKDHIIQNFLMAIAAFIFLYRAFTPTFASGQFKHWLYGVLALAAIFNAIFVNDGRSGYFIFAALLLFSGILFFRWRGFVGALFLAGLLSGLAYHFSDQFRDRITVLAQNTAYYRHGEANTSVGIRIQSIKNAYLLFKEHPWIGCGTGSFHMLYKTLQPEKTKVTGDMRLSYNSYLNVGVELGMIGVVLLFLNFFIQWKYSFLLSSDNRYFMQALLISMAVGCLGNSWLSDTTELHLYTLFLGLVFSEIVKKPSTWFSSKAEENRRFFQSV